MKKQLLIFIFIFFGIASVKVNALQNQYSIGTGMYYSEGYYLENEKILLSAIPLVLKVSRGFYSAKLSTNYLFYSQQNITAGENEYRGMGNYYLSGKRIVPTSYFARYVDFQIKLKFPSGNTRSELGSEGLDIKAVSTLYFKLKKNWLLAGVAYKYRENELNNTFSASLAYSGKLSKSLNAGLNLRYEQALQQQRQDIIESMWHIQWKQSSTLKYILYYIRGFKDPVLKNAGGLQVNYVW